MVLWRFRRPVKPFPSEADERAVSRLRDGVSGNECVPVVVPQEVINR